ncbi:MAG: hypothetical protein JNM63_16205 [Spirochaetia bacterium]|nr:hypothetical protein [Spirochaetia bacterium]
MADLSAEEKIKAFFGPTAATNRQGPYFQVCEFIRNAGVSIYGAVHELEMIEVAQLLAAKKKEGLSVEILLEQQWAGEAENAEALRILKEGGVKVYLDRKRSGLMHNKYLVADRKRVLTGSANFTLHCFFRNQNDIVTVESEPLADAYLRDFFRLVDPIFAKQDRYRPKRIEVAPGEWALPVFSSQKTILTEILRAVGTAVRRLDFLAFSYSSAPLAFKMSEAASKGVRLRGLFDDSFESENLVRNWKAVPFEILWRSGADVKYDNENAKLHHKCLVVDGRMVLTGSYNFSQNAELHNAENMLVLESPALAAKYAGRVNELWSRYPEKTLFEEYAVLRNRKQTSISNFEAFEIEKRKSRATLRNKILASPNLRLFVQEVRSGDRLVLRDEASGESFPAKLFGVSAPASGNALQNQEPQASYARQALALSLAKTDCAVRVLGTNESGELLVWLKAPGAALSVNETVLGAGNALLSLREQAWKNPKGEWTLLSNAAHLAASKGAGIFSKPLRLREHPEAFETRLEQWVLDRKTNESALSLAGSSSNAWIANRNTFRFFRPGTADHYEALKTIESPKWIFFASETNAVLAGYRRSQGG